MREHSPEAAETRLNRLLNLILETTVEALGFDAATLTTRHGQEGLATIAATDQRMIALDDAQYESQEGPCLAVLDSLAPIYLEEMDEDDQRWPHFSRTARYLGVRSTLSLHVPSESIDDLAASLNLYARRRLGLNAEQIGAAERYAEQLAATIQSVDAVRSTERLAQDMASAMQSRAVIEQAKGIVMADRRVDADSAFGHLVKLSQHANMKLRDVAQRLVDERTGPAAP